MRISESSLRRIIRDVIAEGLPEDLVRNERPSAMSQVDPVFGNPQSPEVYRDIVKSSFEDDEYWTSEKILDLVCEADTVEYPGLACYMLKSPFITIDREAMLNSLVEAERSGYGGLVDWILGIEN